MKKQTLYSAITYLIGVVVACLVNLLVSYITVKIVNLFIVVDYFASAVVNVVVAFIVVPFITGVIFYYESYKSAEFNPWHICGAVALGGVAHLGLSMLLMFYPFIAGGTRYLALIINFGNKFSSIEDVEQIYLWAYLISFFIYLVVQMCVSLMMGYIAKNKRLKIREELMYSNQ